MPSPKAPVIERALKQYLTALKAIRPLTRDELKVYNAAMDAVRELKMYEEPGR